MKIEIYENKPAGFAPAIEVSACYVEAENKFLLLQHADYKEQAGKWGLPAGKFEMGENALQAMQRELYEETGLMLEHFLFRSLGSLYVRKPGADFIFHLFKAHFNACPKIQISMEHKNYMWVSFNEAKEYDLMPGAQHTLNFIASK